MKSIATRFITVSMSRDELLEAVENHIRLKTNNESAFVGLTVSDFIIRDNDETDKAVQVFFSGKGEEI